ncbi:KGK domain-containing protein [Dapis sp. BLCC M172]|uniref:KGK domain-containing protein n=1 Tax=Dapis sp. BLCC M172 TaxID=2975281 RepID=UPI003CF4CE2E
MFFPSSNLFIHSSSKENLIFNAFHCKVLKLGSSGCVKGKIKLALEFYRDKQEFSQPLKPLKKNSLKIVNQNPHWMTYGKNLIRKINQE